MRRRPRKPKLRIRSEFTINEEIRAPEVRVISDDGKLIGVLSRQAALELAEQEGKDLILIAALAQPPVAKLIELSKHKYQQQQKKQSDRKASKTVDIKELRLRPFIAEGDLQSRIKKIREFIEDGDKVKLDMRFRGREITKKEFGDNVFNQIIAAVSDVASVEIPAKLQGKSLFMQLQPSKKGKA